jgi:hypothetical protein
LGFEHKSKLVSGAGYKTEEIFCGSRGSGAVGDKIDDSKKKHWAFSSFFPVRTFLDAPSAIYYSAVLILEG